MQLTTRLIGILLGLSLSQVQAADDPATAFGDLLAEIDSMSGDFVQEVRNAEGEVLQTQTGQMTMQRPRQLHWEMESPRQIMICDGEQIYLYDPDLEQVVVRPWRQDPTQNPASLFTSDVELGEWFDISRTDQGYRLTPLKADSMIREIRVPVREDGRPVGFTVVDSSGQVNATRFSNLSFNASYPKERFRFDPPPGVDVIVDE